MNTKSLERSKLITTIVTYGALIIGSVVMVFPFVWMILTSSKTVSESMQVPPDILPKQLTLANFSEAMESLPL